MLTHSRERPSAPKYRLDLLEGHLGRIPALTLWAAAGLFACSVGNALTRSTATESELLYWLGLLLIAVPIFWRLTGKDAGYGERLVLIALLGLALFGVKAIRDSILFNFPDEFVHAFNAEQISATDHLYGDNPALPITPRFPGLGSAASALIELSGISAFAAGMILIAAARVAFVSALFLVFCRVGGSARIAGIGVALYTGASNFLFWGAQFAYESLALPLLVVVLFAFVEREAAPRTWREGYAMPVVLGIVAIAVTHHLTSYALAVTFIALAVLYRVLRVDRPNPWPFALLAVVAAGGWLLIAARETVDYLVPVLTDAIGAIFKTAAGEDSPRAIFQTSESSLGVTPLLARGVALLAIALLLVAFLLGTKVAWRRFQREPLVLLFGVAAVGFFGALGLRFAPAAWETGNRAGEFFFIGLAFIAAFGIVELQRHAAPLGRLRSRAAVVAVMAVVLVGGAISGWPWDVQMARPLRISAAGNQISSEPLALAEWSKRRLDGSRFAAPAADARLLLQPGGQVAFAGQGPDIEDIVNSTELEPWQLPLLRTNRLRYVVIDRREISGDTLRGYYFEVPGQGDDGLYDRGVYEKFDRLPAGRIWDSGNIFVFDLEAKP